MKVHPGPGTTRIYFRLCQSIILNTYKSLFDVAVCFIINEHVKSQNIKSVLVDSQVNIKHVWNFSNTKHKQRRKMIISYISVSCISNQRSVAHQYFIGYMIIFTVKKNKNNKKKMLFTRIFRIRIV